MEFTLSVVNDVFYHLEDFHQFDTDISGVVNQLNAALYLCFPLHTYNNYTL